jgi:hypothetical protein
MIAGVPRPGCPHYLGMSAQLTTGGCSVGLAPSPSYYLQLFVRILYPLAGPTIKSLPRLVI